MAKKVSRVLFVGRFQPFHRGHLSVIQDMLKKFDEVVIGIGSADKSRTLENPFTVGERHAMARSALLEVGVMPTSFSIIPIPDIDDEVGWPKHVMSLTPSFDMVVTGNPFVAELFTKRTKKKIKIITPKIKYKISATDVRRAITQGEDLTKYLPIAVVQFLQKIGAARKLVELETTTMGTV